MKIQEPLSVQVLQSLHSSFYHLYSGDLVRTGAVSSNSGGSRFSHLFHWSGSLKVLVRVVVFGLAMRVPSLLYTLSAVWWWGHTASSDLSNHHPHHNPLEAAGRGGEVAGRHLTPQRGSGIPPLCSCKRVGYMW